MRRLGTVFAAALALGACAGEKTDPAAPTAERQAPSSPLTKPSLKPVSAKSGVANKGLNLPGPARFSSIPRASFRSPVRTRIRGLEPPKLPSADRMPPTPKIRVDDFTPGATINIGAPSQQPLPDGTSLVRHVLGSIEDKPEEKPAAPAEKKEETRSEKERPAAPLPARTPDKSNCLLLLEHGTARERRAAIDFVAREGIRDAVPALARYLNDEGFYSESAAYALAAIGGPAAARALHASARKAALPGLRLVAFDALASMPEGDPDRYIPQYLAHENEALRSMALQAAVARGLQAARPHFEKVLSDSQRSPFEKIWAAAGLEAVATGHPSARQTLVSALQGSDPDLKAAAVEALAAAATSWSIGQIAGLVYSNDYSAARNMLLFLHGLPPEQGLAVLDNASGGYEETPRYRVARALLSGEADGAVLSKALLSGDPVARNLAIEAAAVFKTGGAVDALGALARNTASGVERDAAIAALRIIGTREAADTLNALGQQ